MLTWIFAKLLRHKRRTMLTGVYDNIKVVKSCSHKIIQKFHETKYSVFINTKSPKYNPSMKITKYTTTLLFLYEHKS